MNQNPAIKAQMARALRLMGAKAYQVIRTPRDPNGQPSGEPQEAGKIYGLCYKDADTRNRVHIAIPGMVVSGNEPTLTAVLLCGSAPEKGDTIHRCGKESEAVNVIVAAPLVTITLQELI